MSANPLFEPNADSRSMAAVNYELYQAHVQAGFSEDQAMLIVTTAVSSMVTTALFQAQQEGEV